MNGHFRLVIAVVSAIVLATLTLLVYGPPHRDHTKTVTVTVPSKGAP